MGREKLLYITSRIPFPLDKGDKLRAYQQLSILSERYEVYLFCLTDRPMQESDQKALYFCKDIRYVRLPKLTSYVHAFSAFVRGGSATVGYFYSNEGRRVLDTYIKELEPHRVVVQLLRAESLIKYPERNYILDYMDSFSLNYLQESRLGSPLWRWFYELESNRIKELERTAASMYRKKMIISKRDADAIVSDSDGITVVPNWVDHQYFQPIDVPKEWDIAFVGNLSYKPNQYASKYLWELSTYNETTSELRFNITGKNPPEWLLQKKNAGFEVHGWQDDIRQTYGLAKIFVAPIFTGAGMQNKILEAMAMKVPVITTSYANASLGAEDRKHVLIANNKREFAQRIAELLDNNELRIKLIDNAYLYINEHFTKDVIAAKLLRLVGE